MGMFNGFKKEWRDAFEYLKKRVEKSSFVSFTDSATGERTGYVKAADFIARMTDFMDGTDWSQPSIVEVERVRVERENGKRINAFDLYLTELPQFWYKCAKRDVNTEYVRAA